MKDLKTQTVRAGVGRIGAQGATFLLRMGSLMVLARLLSPSDFGLVAMATVAIGLISLLRDGGLSMAMIQRASITEVQLSTLFWWNLLMGAVLGMSSLALAPVLVHFYHEPRLFWITIILGAGFLINGAGAQHSAILQRNMRFGTLSAIEVLSQVGSMAVGIGLAVGGFGYWALVGTATMGLVTTTVGVWVTTGWVPGLPRRGVGILSLLRFGSMATGSILLSYFAANVDKLLVGRFWGAEALGIYGRGYQLIRIPTDLINNASGDIAFSALSRLQSDPDRYRTYFLSGYAVVLALHVPIIVGAALFAKDIIMILLGPKWEAVIPIFQVLALGTLSSALIYPLSTFLFSHGMVGRSLKIALVLPLAMMMAYYFAVPYGPIGLAVAYSAVMTLWVLPHLAWCVHGTNVSLRDLLGAIRRPVISAIVAAGGAIMVRGVLEAALPPFPSFIVGGSVMLFLYLWMLLYVMGQKAFYFDLIKHLRTSPDTGAGD